MDPNPVYHNSASGTERVLGHRLATGDILDPNDLLDTKAGWIKCAAPSGSPVPSDDQVWVRPLGLPEPMPADVEPSSTPADEDGEEPIEFTTDAGKLVALYVPESNTLQLTIEGTVNFGWQRLAELGELCFQASKFVARRANLNVMDMLVALGIPQDAIQVIGVGTTGECSTEGCACHEEPEDVSIDPNERE